MLHPLTQNKFRNLLFSIIFSQSNQLLMKIDKPTTTQDLESNPRLKRLFLQLEQLIEEINKREIPDEVTALLNKDIQELNTSTATNGSYMRLVKSKQGLILKNLEKHLKIVPINYYRNIWLAVGMTAFGLPFGTLLGFLTKNMGLIGIGLPLGVAIGSVIGINADKKAEKEGRQLNIQLKY